MPVRDDRRAVCRRRGTGRDHEPGGPARRDFYGGLLYAIRFEAQGRAVRRVLLHVSDAHAFRPVRTGVTLLYRIREMWPRQFRWKPQDGKPRRFISLLAGCGAFEDEPPAPEALLAAWEADSAAFARRKAAYHLYK